MILQLEGAYCSESVVSLDCYSGFHFWLHFFCNCPQTSTISWVFCVVRHVWQLLWLFGKLEPHIIYEQYYGDIKARSFPYMYMQEVFLWSYVAHYVIKVLIFGPGKGTFYAYAYVIYYIHTYNRTLYTYINACTYMHPQRKQHPLCPLSGYRRAFTITLYSSFITFFLAFSLCLREGRGGNHTSVNFFSPATKM